MQSYDSWTTVYLVPIQVPLMIKGVFRFIYNTEIITISINISQLKYGIKNP